MKADDPRMPTSFPVCVVVVTLRLLFVKVLQTHIGVTKQTTPQMASLESCIREDPTKMPRAMAVIDPVKLVIETTV
uniref:Glutamine--tRNA ligase n=2 Tax=Salmonella sp. TaxID=599 RepID=A0A482ETP7_SALSP|nr:Glutamine--tRNA ligase [Salmonella sp.]